MMEEEIVFRAMRCG